MGHFTEEQIIGILRQAETGVRAVGLCWQHVFSDATFYKWRSKFDGMNVTDAKHLTEMVRARKVLKDWNAKMEEEGKPHMRILMKDVPKRVTQRRRKARMTPKARQKGEAFQSVWR